MVAGIVVIFYGYLGIRSTARQICTPYLVSICGLCKCLKNFTRR